jgi:hypothetical protein
VESGIFASTDYDLALFVFLPSFNTLSSMFCVTQGLTLVLRTLIVLEHRKNSDYFRQHKLVIVGKLFLFSHNTSTVQSLVHTLGYMFHFL